MYRICGKPVYIILAVYELSVQRGVEVTVQLQKTIVSAEYGLSGQTSSLHELQTLIRRIQG